MAEASCAYETCPVCGAPTRLDRLDGLLRCSERPADCSWTVRQGDPRVSSKAEQEPPEVRPVLCPTRAPEPHQMGEFPMTCYRCHIDADS